jgi:hypothetical protein
MKPVPAKFYKYRRVDGFTEAIFARNELFFAAPGSFNDPFDSAFHVLVEGRDNQMVFESMAFQEIRRKSPNLSMREALEAAQQVGAAIVERKAEEFRAITVEKLARDTNDKVGILSLSEKADDLLMWSHYADCHKGICLEFSTSQPSYFQRARPVNYGDEFSTLNLHDIVVDEDLRNTAPWMLMKARQWEYEKEWRVLDFENGPGPRAFPPDTLSAVILGCRITDENREIVSSWLQARGCEIALYQAKQVTGHFGLSIEPLPSRNEV